LSTRPADLTRGEARLHEHRRVHLAVLLHHHERRVRFPKPGEVVERRRLEEREVVLCRLVRAEPDDDAIAHLLQQRLAARRELLL